MLDPITIQSALKAAGHYTGELDSVFGPRSRAAADAHGHITGDVAAAVVAPK